MLIGHPEQLEYKYFINVDGDTAAWHRLSWQMLSGSVPLKVDSTKVEWFYNGMQPWVHYVPINKDYSDLLANIQWLKDND